MPTLSMPRAQSSPSPSHDNPYRQHRRHRRGGRRSIVVDAAAALILLALAVVLAVLVVTRGWIRWAAEQRDVDRQREHPANILLDELRDRFESQPPLDRARRIQVLVVAVDAEGRDDLVEPFLSDPNIEVDIVVPPNDHDGDDNAAVPVLLDDAERSFGAIVTRQPVPSAPYRSKKYSIHTSRSSSTRVWKTDLTGLIRAVTNDVVFALDDVGQYHGAFLCSDRGGIGVGDDDDSSSSREAWVGVVQNLLVEGGLLLTCFVPTSRSGRVAAEEWMTPLSSRTGRPLKVLRTATTTMTTAVDGNGSSVELVAALSGVDVNDASVGRPSIFPDVMRYHHEASHHDKRHHAVGGGGRRRGWSDQPDKFLVLDGIGDGGDNETAAVIPLRLNDGPYPNGIERKGRGSVMNHRKAPLACSGNATSLDVSRFLQDAFGVTAWKVKGTSRWSVRSHPSSGGLQTMEVYVLGVAVGDGSKDDDSCRWNVWHYNSFWHVLQRRGRVPFFQRALGRSAQAMGGCNDFNRVVFLLLTAVYWRNSWKYGEPGYWKGNLDAGHAIGSAAAAARVQGFRAMVMGDADDNFLAKVVGLDESHDDCTDRFCVNAQHPVGMLAIVPDDQGDMRSNINQAILSMDFSGGGEILEKATFLHELDLPPKAATTLKLAQGYCAAYKRRGTSPVPVLETHECCNNSVTFFGENGRLALSNAMLDRRSAKTYSASKSNIPLADFLDVVRCLRTGCGIAPFFPWRSAVHVLFFVHAVEGMEPGLYLLDRGIPPGPNGSSRRLHEALRYALPNLQRSLPRHIKDTIPYNLDHDDLLLESFFFIAGNFDTRRVAQLLSREQEIARDATFVVSFVGDLNHSLLRESPHWYRYVHWEAGALGHQLYLMAEAISSRGSGIGSFYNSMMRHFCFGHAGFSSQLLPFHPVYHFTFGKANYDERIQKEEPYFHLRQLRRAAMKKEVGFRACNPQSRHFPSPLLYFPPSPNQPFIQHRH